MHYRTVAEWGTAFAPEFTVERWIGIGLFAPPSYIRLPGLLVRALAAIDRALAPLPILRGMADHRLLILVRR